MSKRCPACGGSKFKHTGGGHDRGLGAACPYFETFLNKKGTTEEAEAYADAHWREHWEIKVGDWVVPLPRPRGDHFGIEDYFSWINQPYVVTNTDPKDRSLRLGGWWWGMQDCRPAWPEEIEAAKQGQAVTNEEAAYQRAKPAGSNGVPKSEAPASSACIHCHAQHGQRHALSCPLHSYREAGVVGYVELKSPCACCKGLGQVHPHGTMPCPECTTGSELFGSGRHETRKR